MSNDGVMTVPDYQTVMLPLPRFAADGQEAGWDVENFSTGAAG